MADTTETDIEIAADGSAAVIIRPVGKPVAKAAKAASKPAARKSKAKPQEVIETTVAPEPQPETEAEAPVADDDTQVNLDQTEVPGATRLEEPAAEAPAPQAAPKSVFSMGSKVKDIQEDAPAQTEAATPRPVGTSIFSKVGKAS